MWVFLPGSYGSNTFHPPADLPYNNTPTPPNPFHHSYGAEYRQSGYSHHLGHTDPTCGTCCRKHYTPPVTFHLTPPLRRIFPSAPRSLTSLRFHLIVLQAQTAVMTITRLLPCSFASRLSMDSAPPTCLWPSCLCPGKDSSRPVPLSSGSPHPSFGPFSFIL